MPRLLGVDCDLCVCPSDTGWYKWLSERGQQLYQTGDYEPVPYNLSVLFPTVEDPYQYWRELDYDQFTPIEGSVEALKALSTYFDIVFITQVKGTHNKSKYYWLEKHFPFMEGVITTKEKYLMNDSVVAMIDDRKEHLVKFEPEKRVLFQTNYLQTVECPVQYTIQGWNNTVVKDLCDLYL